MLAYGFKSALFAVITISVLAGPGFSQTDSPHWNYINKYTRYAVAEMSYSKIPASITMAQALHESRYGTSELAVNANNHFGIKCQTEWTGRRYIYQDDDQNNCFRLYDSVAQSYRDHSDFLISRPRYAPLFQLDPKDYVGWAEGLRQAGYATNPNYAKVLIKLIEDYKLFNLDAMNPSMEPVTAASHKTIPNKINLAVPAEPKILIRNKIRYLVVRPGDNIRKLNKALDLLNWQIRKYNEIAVIDDIQPGQIIYLQPKRIKAEAGYGTHLVKKGENMYDISQSYGIKLKWLYWRNRMIPGTQPRVGQEIWLRGWKPVKK